MKKQSFLYLCILTVVCTMGGCKSKEEPEVVTTEPDTTTNESPFSDYMYREGENQPQIELGYEGVNGYKHTLTFVSEEATGEAVQFLYNGVISSQNPDMNDVEFSLTYTVSSGQTIEVFKQVNVNNENVDSASEHFSKINNFIAMEGEVSVGTTWTQDVSIDNRDYVATTEITALTGDKMTTVTTVPNIEDYLDGLYKETRTYEKGKGLTAFERSTPITYDPFLFVLAYTKEGSQIQYINDTYKTDGNENQGGNGSSSEEDDYVETDHNTSTEDGAVWYAPEEGE